MLKTSDQVVDSSSATVIKEVLSTASDTFNNKKDVRSNISLAATWPELLLEDFDDPSWPTFDEDDNTIKAWALKEKKLLLRVITWNLCARAPPSIDLFRQELLIKKFHIYIVGTEECERSIAQSAIITSKKNWEAYLREGFGESYVPLRSHTLQAIHIIAFVHRSIASLCTVVTSGAVATGAANTLGNKGAVSVFIKIANTRILVTNAHLSAHQGAEGRRNAEFHKISRIMPALLMRKESSLALLDDSGSTSPAGAVSNATQVNNEAEINPNTVDSGASSSTPADNVDSRVDIGNLKLPVEFVEKTFEDFAVNDTKPPVSELASEPNPYVDNTIPVQQTATDNYNDDDDDDDGKDETNLQSTPKVDSFTAASANAAAGDVTLDQIADIVIFMGDLNYRINGNRSIIDKLLATNMHDVLINNDQLTLNMKKGLVFNKYVEPPLSFRPTYKFDLGSDEYDTGSKKRIPSWTDRILYVPSDACHCLAYSSANTIKTSDHRPVYASFLVNLNTFVSLDENQEAVIPAKVEFTSESQVCTIM